MTDRFLFSTATELVVLPSDALVFVCADGNYSVLHTVQGTAYTLTMQLGQVEKHIAQSVKAGDIRFVRIGKSLIVNSAYITYVNHARQRLTLSDCRTFKHELTASREALKALKHFIEHNEAEQ